MVKTFSNGVLILDALYGDCGKGTTIDALARKYKSEWVIRFHGGAQAAHNVITPEGVHHTFAQFGSGTLAGAKTFLTRDVLINPNAMLREAEALATKGVAYPLNLMHVDEKAKITTPWHIALNRLREMSRGTGRHGSCGLGIGETMQDAILHPDHVLRVEHVRTHGALNALLQHAYNRLTLEFRKLPEQESEAWKDYANWFQPSSIAAVYDELRDWGQRVQIAQEPVWAGSNSCVLWEGAQGVLLDEKYGFHPYTTWSTTTPQNARTYTKELGLEMPKVYAVTRTYAARHGAGPFPSEVSHCIHSETHNATNDWQREFRQGWLDIPLLQYAQRVAGPFDGLIVTHTDVKPDHIVTQYNGGALPVPVSRAEQIANTETVRQWRTAPEAVNPAQIAEIAARALGVPLVGTSCGPTFQHKIWTV